MTAVIDDAEEPIAVSRVIVVTPEDPNDSVQPAQPVVLALPRMSIAVQGKKPSLAAHPPILPPAMHVSVTQPPAQILREDNDSPAFAVALAMQAPPEPVVTGPADAPPITVKVRIPTEDGAIPAMRVHVRMPLASTRSGTLTLTSPDDQEVIAMSQPEFVVAMESADTDAVYKIVIQYDDTESFTNTPVTVVLDAPVVDGGVEWTPPTPVFAHTYWRARLLDENNAVIVDWTAPNEFFVSTVISTGTLEVTWTVAASAVRPIHLWHFDPAAVEEGELVTVYGQGFPLSTGSLTLNGEPIAAASWELVEQNSTMDDTRMIDGAAVDPEHFEVTFVAPAADDLGGPLTVEA